MVVTGEREREMKLRRSEQCVKGSGVMIIYKGRGRGGRKRPSGTGEGSKTA